MTYDGQILVGAESSGDRLYLSTNYGGNFDILPSAGTDDFGSVAISKANGSVIVATAGYDSPIYISTDMGMSFTSVVPYSVYEVFRFGGHSIVISADGNKIIVLAYQYRDIYYSHDRGSENSWNYYQISTARYRFTQIAANHDLSIAVACTEYVNYRSQSGRLFLSTDFGVSFTALPAIDNSRLYNWQAIDMSYDGSVIFAASNYVSSYGDSSGYLYMSTDYGTSFIYVPTSDDDPKDWQAVKVSGDGLKLFAAVYGGSLYRSDAPSTSNNNVSQASSSRLETIAISGVSETSANYRALAMSNDSSIVATAVYSGKVYVSYYNPCPEGQEPLNYTTCQNCPKGFYNDIRF
jgi:hypothetical protein